MVALGIFFWGERKSLKNLNENFYNKKRIWIYRVLDKKKKKKVLQFPSKFSNFELLHDSSLWVFIAIVDSYDHFILLSLSSIFIFM